MSAVLYGGAGTAKSYKLGEKYGGMAGKTGTVQVKRITLAQREKGITKILIGHGQNVIMHCLWLMPR